MVPVKFVFNQKQVIIKCSYDEYMEEICNKFAKEIQIKKDKLIFFYRGNKINQKLRFMNQITKKDAKINRIVIFCFLIKTEDPKSTKKNLFH